MNVSYLNMDADHRGLLAVLNVRAVQAEMTNLSIMKFLNLV